MAYDAYKCLLENSTHEHVKRSADLNNHLVGNVFLPAIDVQRKKKPSTNPTSLQHLKVIEQCIQAENKREQLLLRCATIKDRRVLTKKFQVQRERERELIQSLMLSQYPERQQEIKLLETEAVSATTPQQRLHQETTGINGKTSQPDRVFRKANMTGGVPRAKPHARKQIRLPQCNGSPEKKISVSAQVAAVACLSASKGRKSNTGSVEESLETKSKKSPSQQNRAPLRSRSEALAKSPKRHTPSNGSVSNASHRLHSPQVSSSPNTPAANSNDGKEQFLEPSIEFEGVFSFAEARQFALGTGIDQAKVKSSKILSETATQTTARLVGTMSPAISTQVLAATIDDTSEISPRRPHTGRVVRSTRQSFLENLAKESRLTREERNASADDASSSPSSGVAGNDKTEETVDVSSELDGNEEDSAIPGSGVAENDKVEDPVDVNSAPEVVEPLDDNEADSASVENEDEDTAGVNTNAFTDSTSSPPLEVVSKQQDVAGDEDQGWNPKENEDDESTERDLDSGENALVLENHDRAVHYENAPLETTSKQQDGVDGGDEKLDPKENDGNDDCDDHESDDASKSCPESGKNALVLEEPDRVVGSENAPLEIVSEHQDATSEKGEDLNAKENKVNDTDDAAESGLVNTNDNMAVPKLPDESLHDEDDSVGPPEKEGDYADEETGNKFPDEVNVLKVVMQPDQRTQAGGEALAPVEIEHDANDAIKNDRDDIKTALEVLMQSDDHGDDSSLIEDTDDYMDEEAECEDDELETDVAEILFDMVDMVEAAIEEEEKAKRAAASTIRTVSPRPRSSKGQMAKHVRRIQAVFRGYRARIAFRLALYEDALSCGVLGAMPGTIQGRSGWYLDPKRLVAYYFVIPDPDGDWEQKHVVRCSRLVLTPYDMKHEVLSKISEDDEDGLEEGEDELEED